MTNKYALAAKRQRRRLERRWKATGSERDRVAYRKACRAANATILQARRQFYMNRIVAADADPRHRWTILRDLLHSTSPSEILSVQDCKQRCRMFADFFTQKVRAVKSKIASSLDQPADPLYADKSHHGDDMHDVTPPTIEEVKKLITSMPLKSSNMDVIPTRLLKSCVDVFAPLIARLASLSFRDGCFPARFKVASVTPLLKKAGLDSDVPSNYRPISNLNNVSKIIEKLFLQKIIGHVSRSSNFNERQSAYRRGHSTETALLCLLNDVYCAAEKKNRSLLILLDLSAAFDTLDINTLLRRLELTFGITGTALSWLRSYLSDRSQFVRVGSEQSATTVCEFGVPQGSVLGPLLFTLYIAPIAAVISSFGVRHLQYADDTQLYVALENSDSVATLEHCADALYEWFSRNGLSLNPDKSEAIVMGTSARLRTEAPTSSVTVSGSCISVANTVKSLGVTLDSALTFDHHVRNICKSSAYHLRALRHIRRSIDEHSAQSIACSLVGARIDYCNALLYGTSQANIDRLQRLQNSLARTVTGVRKYDHITPTLKQLHWLPISARINYKIALLTYKTLAMKQPEYLSTLIRQQHPVRQLRSSSHRLLATTTARSIFSSRAFCHAAPNVWNSLPYDVIDNSASLTIFKQKLKTHLFLKSYCT